MDLRSRRVPREYPPGPVPDGETNDPTSRPNSVPLNPGPSIQQQERRPGPSDFLAIGPGLRIFQLNVEGLSASKRSLIEELVTKHDIDVICLQETHIEGDVASRFSITGYDLLHYTLHKKFGRATYIRSDLTDASCVPSHPHCNIIKVGDFSMAIVYRPPSEAWSPEVLPCFPHPAIYIADFNSQHSEWGYSADSSDGISLAEWANSCDLHLVYDPKQNKTFHSRRWNSDTNPDLCWVSSVNASPLPASNVVLGNFPHSQHRPSVVHIGLLLTTIHSVPRPRWNFPEANWPSYAEAAKRSNHMIPKFVSIEEAYSRFCRAISKAATQNIPRGYRPVYIPCLDSEIELMLREYEESGDPDIAAHIIESLEASRRQRWEAAMEQLDFTHSSRKGWNLLRKLGAAQRPPATKHFPVSANQVASHLVNVAKAPLSKPVKRQVHDEWRQYTRSRSNSYEFVHFSISELDGVLESIK